jgi:hypothetical protein
MGLIYLVNDSGDDLVRLVVEAIRQEAGLSLTLVRVGRHRMRWLRGAGEKTVSFFESDTSSADEEVSAVFWPDLCVVSVQEREGLTDVYQIATGRAAVGGGHDYTAFLSLPSDDRFSAELEVCEPDECLE